MRGDHVDRRLPGAGSALRRRRRSPSRARRESSRRARNRGSRRRRDSSSHRAAWRALLLPCVTATLTMRKPASRCSRSASAPMMHSSSGCGEKIRARGASAASGGRGGFGKPPSGNCLPSCTSRASVGDELMIGSHARSRGDRRQARRGDGLAVTLVVLVGHVKRDAARPARETRRRAPRARRRRCRRRRGRTSRDRAPARGGDRRTTRSARRRIRGRCRCVS